MGMWNDWTDEHWDVVAMALAFTTAVAFAFSVVLMLCAVTARIELRAADAGVAPAAAVDLRPALDDRATP